MKKGVFVLSFLIAVCLIGIVSAEIRINEVMPRTSDSSAYEWIEIYSTSQIELIDWKIDVGQSKIFNYTLIDYLIITKDKTLFLNNFNINESKVMEWTGIGLVDGGESINLYDNLTNVISTITYPSFSSNENKSYSLLSNLTWIITSNATPGQLNYEPPPSTPTCTQNWSCSAWNTCSSNSQTRTCTDTNSCGNTTGKPTENQTCTISTGEYIELNWTEEIFNKDEFEIEVDLFNLLSQTYDVKVWITFSSNDTTISEIYNSDDDDWSSGTYYLTSFISGTGNKTKDVKIRLKESYQDFDGNARIFARLRYNNGIIDEYERTFPISASDETSTSTSSTATTDTDTPITAASVNSDNEEIIVLGSSSTKTTAQKTTNSIIYKSKMEYIKDYAPYLLSVVCIFIIIILMIEKTNKTKNKKNV